MGRYFPQLNFLEVILGDEPVLSPQTHFYQRLLALDDNEARQIANTYLAANPLASLYDSVLIPALSLAERDRDRNALDETRSKFIHESTRELIEDLYEKAAKATAAAVRDQAADTPPPKGVKIICIPARDEADAIVGTMAAQLLCNAGLTAEALAVAPLATILEQVEQFGANIICVSASPPLATSGVKALCKKLKLRFPSATIVVGLWGYGGQPEEVLERLGPGFVDGVGVTLMQVVSLASDTQTVDGQRTAIEEPTVPGVAVK